MNEVMAPSEEPATVVISGGGIVGLALAMSIKQQLGITAEIYEKAHTFADDVGAGLGMVSEIGRTERKEVETVSFSHGFA